MEKNIWSLFFFVWLGGFLFVCLFVNYSEREAKNFFFINLFVKTIFVLLADNLPVAVSV